MCGLFMVLSRHLFRSEVNHEHPIRRAGVLDEGSSQMQIKMHYCTAKPAG
jgi:hypothetical protein